MRPTAAVADANYRAHCALIYDDTTDEHHNHISSSCNETTLLILLTSTINRLSTQRITANISINLYCQKLESLSYMFVADTVSYLYLFLTFYAVMKVKERSLDLQAQNRM